MMRKLLLFYVRTRLNLLGRIAPARAGALAWRIFRTPRKGRLTETDEAFLAKSERKTLFFQDISISTYHWPGQNGLILLAHGWESNAARWRKMIAALQTQGFGIVALDAPAHGASGSAQFSVPLYSNMIAEVVRHFQPDAVVAHSVGGMATTLFLSQHRNTVQATVLLGVPDEMTQILKGYQHTVGFSDRVNSALRHIMETEFGHGPEEYSTPAFVKTLSIKGLVIHDPKDRVTPFGGAKAIAAAWPNAELLPMKGCGHGLNKPEVLERVGAFLVKVLKPAIPSV